MLELSKITKTYKTGDTEVTVLKGISLTLRPCEFVCVLGPSGCGKTTMLNIIGGLDKYTSGDLIINGRSTKSYRDRDWDTYRNHTIGFVFQSYNLIPHQSVLKNVELALSIGGISKAERRQRAKDALIKVGLEDHMNKKPSQLSGGQCQRVSIARALVTNPDIILADEPTGALDTETSLQIMEILNEISKDRLVLMVTHNPDLAGKYATRTVRMRDGMILSDSNPVGEEERIHLETAAREKEESVTPQEKKRAERKSSMSLWTSTGLSVSNLLTKKKRTFLTALACSIGIIGISVVLSVSSGMQGYVETLQQDSAASNYITISTTASPLTMMSSGIASGPAALMTDGGSTGSSSLTEYPDSTDGLYLYTEQSGEGGASSGQAIPDEYIEYLEKNINGDTEDTSLVLGISYTRSVGINLISDTGAGYVTVDTGTCSFTELLDNEDYMATQFTVLSGSGMPKAYNEVALVADSYNRISTNVLDALGIEYSTDGTAASGTDYASADSADSTDSADSSSGGTYASIPYDDIVGKEFRLAYNDDFYVKETYGNSFLYRTADTDEEMEAAYSGGVSVKIVSVIRLNEDASSTWASSGIAYTQALTDKVIEMNSGSDIVKDQIANPDYDVLTGNDFETENAGGIGGAAGSIISQLLGSSSTSYETNLAVLGGTTVPSSITIYPKDYDSKDVIIEILDRWNTTEIYKVYGNETDENGNYIAENYMVSYTDVSALAVTMLNSIINIITYVLVAFSAISLIVSSIMIAIITYASVIERTKEIGTIRSLGGRKRDVSAVFIIEACIIGLVSAAIALVLTLAINAIINVALGAMVGVSTIASLSGVTAIEMIALAVGLNLIASIIPSRIAAHKDPVVALRTE